MASSTMDLEKGDESLDSLQQSVDPDRDGAQTPASGLAKMSTDTGRPSTSLSKASSTTLVEIGRRFSRLTSTLKRILGPKKASPQVSDTRATKLIVKQIHLTPHGYPKLAAFLESDDNFKIYRRFGYLQSRLLVEKQNDLQRLETKLAGMDDEAVAADKTALMTRKHYKKESCAERVALLAEIERKWTEYSGLLLAAQQMTSLNKPSSVEHRSVRRWVEGKNPVNDADAEFILQKEDLITLRPGREHAWLDAAVEKLIAVCDVGFVRRLFQSEETRRKTDGSGSEIYYTRSRIDKVVVTIITLMILMLLVLPVYLLFRMSEDDGIPRSDFACIGVLLVFTLAFSACISLFTKARRHEILAASAGYCAVLVVFIGNLGQRLPLITSSQR